MIERPQSTTAPPPPPELGWAAAGLAATVLIAWLAPTAVAWLHDGTIIRPVDAMRGTIHLVGQQAWEHPSASWVPRARRHMPADAWWWAGGGWAILTLLALGLGARKQVLRLTGEHRLGRRQGIRGARPRAWARARDLAALSVRAPRPGRFTLGRLENTLLASEPESHVALIAPTRSGKTSRYVIPWLLEHDGPALVTSTKSDVLRATERWRAKRGRVMVWDPFGPRSDHWTPLAGCEDWEHALAQAQWLGDAAQDGDSDTAAFWRGEAARLLAPLLHAAALQEGSIAHVLAWIDSQDARAPADILDTCGAVAAKYQLGGIAALDPRNKGTIYMSAASLLAAYRLPSVQATAHPGFDAEAFLDGGAHTLYLIASSRQQRLLAPLTVAIVSGLIHAAAERADRQRPLDPTLRVLLDETANIAPLRDLPSHLSQAAGHGVRIATVWQSLSQAQQRYGAATDDIIANSTAKLYLGPVTDDTTRRHITALLGDEPVDQASISSDVKHRSQTTMRSWRPKATAPALQQLSNDRALMVSGRSAPAVVDTAAWWETRRLRRRGRTTR